MSSPHVFGDDARLPRDPRAVEEQPGTYLLTLYVTGLSPHSSRAVTNAKRICNRYLPERHRLRIVDLYQQPELAQGMQIIAAPTLVRELPLPQRRIVGDLSDEARVLRGLELEGGP